MRRVRRRGRCVVVCMEILSGRARSPDSRWGLWRLACKRVYRVIPIGLVQIGVGLSSVTDPAAASIPPDPPGLEPAITPAALRAGGTVRISAKADYGVRAAI